MTRERMLFAAACFILSVFALSGAALAQMYTVTDVGTLGGSASTVEAINNSGATAGASYTGNNSCCDILLYSDGKDIDLGSDAGGYAINASNQVAGYGETANGYRAFVASVGHLTSLPTLGGNSGVAYALNDRGDVAGWSTTSAGAPDAFLYHKGVITDLGTLGGIGDTIAYGINNAGQIVGSSWNPQGNYQAFLWENGTMTGLESPIQNTSSQARAINRKGQITGRTYNGIVDHAFLYSNGKMRDIDPNKDSLSVGLAINNRGVIVGYTENAQGVNPFVWNGKKLLNLNKLIPRNSGWSLWHATGINDAGQISGDGTLNNQNHGFILTPVK
jgi:probable HAF family extracellular repeat protein